MDLYKALAKNTILWIAVLAWAIAQIIKIAVDFQKTGKIKPALMISSGGMPSSHSALVVAMTTSIGLIEGCHTTLFAVSAVLSMVVMYDAAGVRRAAGTQARVINMMVANLENQGILLDKKLKELLGHSPTEVGAGAILGIAVAFLICSILSIG